MPESRLARQIATAVRREREHRRLTQQALADLAGLSQGAVARIERGDRLPSLPVVERLFAALGEHRWLTRYGELRARMCDELPDPIEVRHGGRGYSVEPLARVELTDPRAADLLRRYRQRLAPPRAGQEA